MTRYNDIASKGRSLESNILFKILNILEIAELAERIMNELISFLFIKDFLYVEFSSIIDEVGVGLFMNEKLDYKFGKYDLDFLIKLKAHEFRKQKIDNISEKEIRNYLFNIKWKSQKSLPMCDIIDDVMNLQFSEIFDYLSIQAVKEASTLDLAAFQEFISK